MFDTATGAVVLKLPGYSRGVFIPGREVFVAVTGRERELTAYDLRLGRPVATATNDGGKRLTQLAVSRDGRTMAVLAEDEVLVWDLTQLP